MGRTSPTPHPPQVPDAARVPLTSLALPNTRSRRLQRPPLQLPRRSPLHIFLLVLLLPLLSTFVVVRARPPPSQPAPPLYDTKAPELLSLKLVAPRKGGPNPFFQVPLLDVKGKSEALTYVIEATDDLSGIDVVSVLSGRSGLDAGIAVETYYPEYGNQTSDGRWLYGLYKSTQIFPALSPTGMWTVNWVGLKDNLGNTRIYRTRELLRSRYEVNFIVDSENCETNPWQCSQFDELTWMTQPDADDYKPPGMSTIFVKGTTNVAQYYQSYRERSYPEIFDYLGLEKVRHLDGFKCTWQRSSTPIDPSTLC